MKHKAYYLTIAALSGGLSLATISCRDDAPEEYSVSAVLPAPEALTIDKLRHDSISFSWTEIKGAVQYGYVVTDMDGVAVGGGVTEELNAVIPDLAAYTDYIVSVTAQPAIGQGAQSLPATIQAKTLFYPALDEATTTYSSYLRSDAGNTYKCKMTEDRGYDGWQEGWFGYFTITAFYEKEGANLVFKVNRNNTITILQADYSPLSEEDYDEEGRAMVATGIRAANAKILYINENSSVFDAENHTLTFEAKLPNDHGEDTETITWRTE